MNNAAVNILAQVLFGSVFSFLVGECLGVELLGFMLTLYLTF